MYRRQWPAPAPSLNYERLTRCLSSLAEQQGRLAKEWTRISRAWMVVAALFALSALCHIVNLILLWK